MLFSVIALSVLLTAPSCVIATVVAPPASLRDLDIHSRLSQLSLRQGALPCVSPDDCKPGDICLQLQGDLVCEEECNGICMPESNLSRFCTCEMSCENESDICAKAAPEEKDSNGLCLPNESANPGPPIECASAGDTGNTNQVSSPGGNGSEAPDDSTPATGVAGAGTDDPGTDGGTTAKETATPGPDKDTATSGPGKDTATPGSDKDTATPGSDNGDADTGSDDPPAESTAPTPAPEDNPSDTDNGEGPVEASPDEDTVSDSEPEATEEPVCISAEMLSDFSSDELVFPKHVLSRVLCDAGGSCATRGHIVEYKGRGMMMRRYCEIVGCTEDVQLVNSPKYQRGLRVGSRSEGMRFTGLAARFATRGEELALATAVRMGM